MFLQPGGGCERRRRRLLRAWDPVSPGASEGGGMYGWGDGRRAVAKSRAGPVIGSFGPDFGITASVFTCTWHCTPVARSAPLRVACRSLRLLRRDADYSRACTAHSAWFA
jgi:hypothetical protein